MYRSTVNLLRCRNIIGIRFNSTWRTDKSNITQNPKEDHSSIISYKKMNMPDFEMQNPYEKEKKMCILCRLHIVPDYKNIRLLSQFVSRFTGMIYGRHITGLCRAKQSMVEKEIIKAIKAGFMPMISRDPRFAHDPKLFDPDNPFRPHRF